VVWRVVTSVPFDRVVENLERVEERLLIFVDVCRPVVVVDV